MTEVADREERHYRGALHRIYRYIIVLSVAGSVPALQIRGTTADVFTIDTNDTSTTPSLAFHDIAESYFRWNELLDTFQTSNDLSIAGSLTIEVPFLVVVRGS